MKENQDTNLSRNKENLEFGVLDDFLIYDNLLRKRPM
jgi:hypothetical protein